MSRLPTVAIIGRPNTGKSTLFNRLIGRRKAIVSDVPGTTRDHIAGRIRGEQVDYLLVDTGGMGGGTADTDLEDDVHQQSLLALEQADLIICTMSSQDELTASDSDMIQTLRRNKKKHVPVILAITKCDNVSEIDTVLPTFYALRVTDDVIAISAPHKIGIDDLKETIETRLSEAHFEKGPEEDEPGVIPKIAIIGRPNVGKSSILNAFMSEKQRATSPAIVSEIAGTTRDTIDTRIRYNDQEYLLMDTAGIKRQRQTMSNDIETYAYFRSIRALEDCDVAVLVLDATQPVSKQDKRIAGIAVEEGKGIIVFLNKIDLVPKGEREQLMKQVKYDLAFCRYAPVIPCSAESREGILKLFTNIEIVQRNRMRRIATADLHEWFDNAIYNQPLGTISRSKHITQADGVPPTFVLFVKNPKQIQVSQLRFLENRLRETFDFSGTPVRWISKQS